MTDAIFSSHKIAIDEDIPLVCELLHSQQNSAIMLQNVNTEGIRSHFQLIDVVQGPYTWEMSEEFNVLHGHNKKTNDRCSLRLRGCGIVQINNYPWNDWYDYCGDGALRLMIPHAVLT